MTEKKSVENAGRESIGWISMAFFMFLYPVLFFLCVWFPMWMGWAP